MGQVLHGCATTTEAIRRAIQNSQESLRALSMRYGINPKTVAKWKQRGSVADLPTGPKEPKSTSLSLEDEAIIVAFRQHTLQPLVDCLYALQATIPHLTRSSLHRCLQRHGISRLPDVEDGKGIRRKFKNYPIGYFHIDIAEVRTAMGWLYLFVAIDRTSKFACCLEAEAYHRIPDRDRVPRLAAPALDAATVEFGGCPGRPPTGVAVARTFAKSGRGWDTDLLSRRKYRPRSKGLCFQSWRERLGRGGRSLSTCGWPLPATDGPGRGDARVLV